MYDELREVLLKSENIVFLGGAGVSTESGIPDFRSADGAFKATQKYGHAPEKLLSGPFFKRHADVFYEYYRENLIYNQARPNGAHIALATLERDKKLRAVITQNIDGLHQLAGSQNVLELHGSIWRNYCVKCGEKYGLDYIMKSSENPPVCQKCAGVVRPDVVLYGEQLDTRVISKAAAAVSGADVFIVGGTSLMVHPAAGLLNYFNGTKLILINRTQTPYDKYADIVIRDPIGEVLMSAV